jgi:protein TonB
VDTPDPKAAARGGGNVGAPLRYTGRADRGDLRTLPWNDPQAYRLPRHDDGYRRAAPESINRRPEPGLDTQERDRVPTARLAEPAPAPGPTPGEAPGRARPSPPPAEAGTVATAPSAADPAPPAPPAQAARDGAVISRRADPGAETGARATEAERRGPTGDNTTSAQASNERDPGPIEFTRPSAGGTSGGGVAGPNPGAGNSAASPRAGAGQGGTPAAIARGDAAPATRARPQDVYLRRLFRLLADAVEYPADLALGLEQGELVVRFTLLADGSVAELTIARSSGIRAFDDAALAAVRKVTPLGPVPKAVLAGRDRLRVEWPLAFSAPMIR